MTQSSFKPRLSPRERPGYAAGAWSRNAVSLAIACAYVGGTAGVLYVSTGIPTLLRAEGADFHLLALLTFAPVVWACRIFVAPIMDALAARTRIGYRAQVLGARAATIAALAILFADGGGSAVILIGAAAVAAASGIERAALDALAAHTPATHRTALAGASALGVIAGSVFGASVPLLIAGVTTQAAATLTVMGFMAISAFPLLATRVSTVQHSSEQSAAAPHSRPWLMLIGLGLNWVGTSVAFRLGRPLLVDLGTPVASIGAITTILVPLAGVIGAALPLLVFRRPSRGLLVGIIVGDVLWCLLLLTAATQHSTLSAVIGMAIGETAYVGLSMLTTMLALSFASQGRAAATRSSLIDASPYLISHIAAGTLIGQTESAGYPPILLTAAIAVALSAWPLWHAVSRARSQTNAPSIES